MRILRSFLYALSGIKTAFLQERNFKIQILVSIITFLMGFVFQVSYTEWMFILLCCAMVLSLELLNSAIERICNFISPGIHPAIKKIKDYAAGAVLTAALFAVITGLMIFIPKLLMLLK